MTLVQASICEKGNTIIIIADRMVSSSIGGLQYEKEGKSSKLYAFGKNALGCAGMFSDIVKLKQKISLKDDIDEFLEELINVMKNLKEEELERLISFNTLWDSKNEFLSTPKIPQKLYNFIFAQHSAYTLKLNSLIAGFDKEGTAKIYVITPDYKVSDDSDMYHQSIGSGAPFSLIFYDQEDYDVDCSLEEGLYFAFRAKKAAEAHTGVGVNTDILILHKDRDPISISNEDKRMKMLENLYNEEENEIEKFRSEIIKKISIEG